MVEQDGQRFVRTRNWGASHLYWTGSPPKRPREQQVQNTRPRLQVDPTNDRRELGEFREPVLTPQAIYYWRARDLWLKKKEKPLEEVVAFDIAKPEKWDVMHIQGMDNAPRDLVPWNGGQMCDPRTGTSLPNRLWRGINQGTRGCNRALANPHVVVLRDADISYFDLAAGGRQTRLRGIRAGCTNALLPAGGILNAPNLAYHCSCNWPIFTSIALVPMREAGDWDPACSD